jgi:hypothetical protein
MTLAGESFDQRGKFYLGRLHDLTTGRTGDAPLLYESQHLTTHAVCVGMTGSGKTGLCLSLLEEAALGGVPAIAVDPKGDLGNLLLAFPELRPVDFLPWVDASEAARQGVAPDVLAERTAQQWREGLAHWGQDGERIRRFTQAVDRAIYTPGSSAGLPLTILKLFNAPPSEVRDDADAMSDRVQSAASGLLALLGVDADPVQSREHILLSKVLDSAWRAGRDLDLPAIIQEIQRPRFTTVGVVDLESFLPADARHELGMRLNNLLASPSFASWLVGEPLDVGRLLYTDQGHPRLSVVSIAHLGEAERMFFVTLLLNEAVSWMRTQPGTNSLRAILYMDEVFGYFPPTANPPAKRPMLTLLKQARAYGVGCVLATQNPVDLDYKGLSNAGTWFLGRLQTERDKARVIEGLEGASAEAHRQFDRGRMEATLASLGKRVFLMNNVHDETPTVFHTRWALSYLAGPLTRGQIATLMADRRALASASADARPTAPDVARGRPLVSAEIDQKFWPVGATGPKDAQIIYRPGLLGVGRVHYVQASEDLDVWKTIAALATVDGELPRSPWDAAMLIDDKPALAAEPLADATFAELPGSLGRKTTYASLRRDLNEWLYQNQRLLRWKCGEIDESSRPGETEEAFRNRAASLLRAQRQAHAKERLAAEASQLEKEIDKAEQLLAENRWWSASLLLNAASRALEIVVTAMFGRRSRKQVVTATLWNQAMRKRRLARRAKASLKKNRALLGNLKQEERNALAAVNAGLSPAEIELTKIELPPRKSDVDVDDVLLVWLPWWAAADASTMPAYKLPRSKTP